MRNRRTRAGFTLVEVLMVAVVLGILAGVATPRLARATHRAGAAKIVSDARLVSIAVRSHLENGGALPASEAWGVAPTSMNEFLESGMTFSFRDAEYRFVTLPATNAAQLWVRYPLDSGLGNALQRFRQPGTVTWTPTMTTFVLVD